MVVNYSCLYSQSILDIIEITEGGKVYSTVNGGDIIKQYPNIDINSSLNIKLDKGKIMNDASKWLNIVQAIPLDKMKALSDMLIGRDSAILKMRTSDNATLNTKKQDLNDAANFVSPILNFLLTLPPNDPLRKNVNLILSKRQEEIGITYNLIFDVIQSVINSTLEEYEKAVEANKVYFRLGAFINERHVHLDGFDVYKGSEYYLVPRFATAIDENEKKKFDEYKKLAEEANNDFYNAFKNKLKEQIIPLLNKLKGEVETKLYSPISNLRVAMINIDAISQGTKDKIEKSKNDLSQLYLSIFTLIEIAQNISDPEYFPNVVKGVQELIQTTSSIQNDLQTTIADLKNQELQTAKQAFNQVIVSYDLTKLEIEKLIKDFKNFQDSKAELNLSITEKIHEAFLKFEDAVKKIPLADIPEETTLNLLTSGGRKVGDKLYLKAVLGKQPPDKMDSEEKTIEFIPIGLYQIGLHSSIKAALLFVDNTSAQFQSKKQFQLDPSYSVLFKYGSRKHNNYNNFLEIGAGVNIATLDFNNDNIPEIGIGLVASAFKDYLQVGYGRNMASDQWYWFFGIRLPFLSVNLAGSPKMNLEDKL